MPLCTISPRRILRIYNWLAIDMLRGVRLQGDADLTIQELSNLIQLLYRLPDDILDRIRAAAAVI